MDDAYEQILTVLLKARHENRTNASLIIPAPTLARRNELRAIASHLERVYRIKVSVVLVQQQHRFSLLMKFSWMKR